MNVTQFTVESGRSSILHKGDLGMETALFNTSLASNQWKLHNVTELAIPASTQKLYLSPVLDGLTVNRRIIFIYRQEFRTSESYVRPGTTENHLNTILHSDQDGSIALWPHHR